MSEREELSERCRAVDEQMSELLEGKAADELVEHVAECDRCRDARHEAERAARLVEEAGADFVMPAALERRLEQALEQQVLGEEEPAGAVGAGKTEPETLRVPAGMPAEAAPGKTEVAEPAEAALAAASESKPGEPSKPSEASVAESPSKGATQGKVVSLLERLRRPRNALLLAAGCAALAAAAVAIAVKPGSGTGPLASGSWQGKVVQVSRAAGGSGGLEVCDAAGQSCREGRAGDELGKGAQLRTDERTRVYVELGDGTRIALDRATRFGLLTDGGRHARLESGAVVADVAKVEGAGAAIELPTGKLEVLGTKFALRALGESVAVDVSRGAVQLADREGRSVTVRAGEEGRMYPGMAPYASGAQALGEALSWSDQEPERAGADSAVRGLGELRAKKPGTEQEKTAAVKLASHQAKVRIVDGFARTEVEEVFTNTTDEVLEGIYRFPMPPDAQIERLALEVDGKLEEGAFVDRDRAAAIWRGAIVNAAPPKRPLQEEIVWVPGPWRDPALLEWQRGGRFELRIYPIPRQGSRKVILAYTQVVAPVGRVMRYVYPLGHDASGQLKVDDFGLDVALRGHDRSFGVSTQGYALASASGSGDEAERLGMSAKGFVPSGDLVVEYALPASASELEAWTYQPEAGSALATASATPSATAPSGAGKALADQGDKGTKKPDDAAQGKPSPLLGEPGAGGTSPLVTSSSDTPYVLMALRPKLPRSAEQLERAFVLVVDASRSMVGERYRRASELAVRLVEELDQLDRFTALACDTTCRQLPGGLRFPGHQAAKELAGFLAGIEPEGASDLGAIMRSTRAAAGDTEGRALRVVYLGDGTPTVGAIRPRYLEREVRESLPGANASVTAVALGTDADMDALGALARAGGGTVLPYVPGQRLGEAAYAILGASYGTGLREARLELPAGLVEVAPSKLDTIAAGGQALVVARMSRPELEGTVVLRGKVGGQDFEQRYPLKLKATSAAGNAFVPRMYAAQRIGELEREGSADARKGAVELSQRFNVASRYTSLLVLESAAMFKAFGLDNTRYAPSWTGEEQTDSATADGELAVAGDEKAKDELSANGDGVGGGGRASGKKGRADMDSRDDAFGEAAAAPADAWAAPPAATMAQPPAGPAPAKAAAQTERRAPATRPRGGNWVAMRKVWERQGNINTAQLVPASASAQKLGEAENAVRADENRREAVRKLFVLRMLAGQVDSARELAQRWSTRDALDPDALVARADAAASAGQRDQAIRLLGSVVDVRPGDVQAQQRLARLHRWAGRAAVGCRHSLALAQLREKDGKLLAEAVTCARQTGEGATAEDMLSVADPDARKLVDSLLAKTPPPPNALSGDFKLEATWQGAADVDLALLHPEGHRVSWLGAPTKGRISAVDVTSLSHEGLALTGSDAGDYVIEVTRAAGDAPVSGTIVVNVAGTRRDVPFSLGVGEKRRVVGLATVRWQSRLVPM